MLFFHSLCCHVIINSYIGPGPKLDQLEELKVWETVADDWTKLGIFLEFDYEMLRRLDIQHTTSNKNCCHSLLHDWLHGKASAPTWEKLIEALKKLEKTDLADKLNKFVSSKY